MRAPLLLVFAACAGTKTATPAEPVPASEPAREVVYYEGTSATTSPDGATPFGPPVTVVVRRTTDPTTKTIDEYVVHPGEEHPATMTLQEGAVFAATDPKGSFKGTITYSGPAWHYTGWTYNIALTDGSGTITGTGEATATTMKTDKQFVDAGGTPRARIREDFHVIDEATFQKKLAELLK